MRAARRLIPFALALASCAPPGLGAGRAEPDSSSIDSSRLALFDSAVVDGAVVDSAVVDRGTNAQLCGQSITILPLQPSPHIPNGQTAYYWHDPPASGPHWPEPSAWEFFSTPLNAELWVHNLEHGGIVFLYNCPNGCQATIDQLQAIKNGRHPDQFNEQRILATPWKTLSTPLAVVAWNYLWMGDVADPTFINCFIDARYDQAPESLP